MSDGGVLMIVDFKTLLDFYLDYNYNITSLDKDKQFYATIRMYDKLILDLSKNRDILIAIEEIDKKYVEQEIG
jgi:hypothetical protein